MSSLLDILQRKDSRTGDDPESAEPAVDNATQTVELRLAVDNGPADEVADAGRDDQPATAPPPVMPPPAPVTAPDPFATQLLTALQLRQRSRRSSAWLGLGLLGIVLSAAVATWMLGQISPDQTGDDSLFTGTGLNSLAPAPAPAIAAEQPPVSALEEAAAPPTARERVTTRKPEPEPSKRQQEDTGWFDTPATEPEAGTAADFASDSTGESTTQPIRILRGTTSNPVFPRLQEAWSAFQAADYLRAETLYREVLASDAGNVDALLGLGALAARGGRTDEARELYQAVLKAEPKNATAVSALSTLPAQGSRQLDESALRNMLREQPGAANVHFALGLQYVAQGRWPDAQTEFFAAVSNEPTNADYAYNLAVSLDQLGKTGPAAAYYQRALDLASASALFSPAAAQARLNTLRPAGSAAVTP